MPAHRRYLSNGEPGVSGAPSGNGGNNASPRHSRKPKRNRKLGCDQEPGNNPKSPEGNQDNGTSNLHAAQPSHKDSATSEAGLTILGMIHPSRGDECADQVWELWNTLSVTERHNLRLQVIRYLRRIARGEIDVRRCWNLISELPSHPLEDPLILDAVWCTAKLGMHNRVLEFLRLRLDNDQTHKRHLDNSLDPQNSTSMGVFKEILRLSFETASWPLLQDACHTWHMGVFSNEQPSLDFLDSQPGSEDNILKLWQHLKDHENAANLDNSQDVKAPEARNSSPSDGQLSNAAPIPRSGVAEEAVPEPESGQRSPETPHPAAVTDSAAEKNSDDKFTYVTRVLLNAARQALLRPCKPKAAINILNTVRHPELYTLYFQKMASMGTTHHLPGLFDELKRLTASHVDPQILRVMFNVYCPHNPEGLLEVHRLFCRMYYEGSNGSPADPGVLREWWTEYVIRAVLSRYALDPLVFLPYVEESKRYGDSDTAQFAMELVRHNLRFEEHDISWFAELKVFAERLDYEGAMEVWHSRFSSDKPDKVTLVTLLRVASERGDVAFTTGLFDKARRWGLDREPQVLIPVIRAFGLYRSPEEAGNICNWAIENGVRSTEVFNAMLEVYASLYRLHELRNLMKVMAENSIAWDEQTFMHLMKALGRTRRGNDALGLLRKAPDVGLRGLTLEHFETVMAGAVKMGVYQLAYTVARRMREEGLPMTLGAMSLLVKAAHRWRQREEGPPVPGDMEDELKTGKDLVAFYRKMAQADTEAIQRGEKPGPSRDSLTVKRVAFTLAEMGDAESLYELASVYLDALQNNHSERHLPNGVLTAFMIVEFERGNHERVKQLWRILWDRHQYSALQRMEGVEASYRTAPKVHPRSQYGLDEGFRIMEQVLTLEGNADGLLKLIFDITSQGYMLGQRSWNHAIQSLVTMGKWKEAFKFNEQMLMPNWTGWRHFRRFKNARRRHAAWDKHDALLEEHELVEDEAEAGKPPPEDDPSLSPEERQYWSDHRLVGEFLRHMYTWRKTRRMQKQRKLKGTSITLAPRIRDPGRNPRYLRPNAHTLHQLARAYLEMEESNSWIGNSQEWLSMFCPVSVLAVRTLRYADEVEAERREQPEEWDDSHDGAESLEGTEEREDEYEDAEGLEDTGGKQEDAEELARAEEGHRGEIEGVQSKPHRVLKWKERGLPPSLRAAISHVLDQAPRRRRARQREKAKRKREQRKALAALQQEEIERRTWEEMEAEARERERAEWMRRAGIVDAEELKEEPLTTENFFGDETDEEKGEKSEKSEDGEDEEEEEEEFERDPRRRKHKARRGKKLR